MGKKVFIPATVAAVVIILASVYLIYNIRHMADRNREEVRQIAVTSNSIDKKIEAGDIEGIISDSEELKNFRLSENETGTAVTVVIVTAVTAILMIFISSLYLYIRVIRPFYELKDYSADIAAGNLDKPLKVHRGNYFGEFTSAFDDMREELVRTRTSEKEAVEKNKTIISALSHDIKTPIASIRAYAEAFEANMDSTPEKREKYLRIIMEKCDEVTRLTNDLFIHSISELDKLDVKLESVDIISFVDDKVRHLFVDESEVTINLPDRERLIITADPKRLLQVFENLKSNAEKYARSKIEITLECKDEASAAIHFRDFGPGIREEEIPFLTEKFYRGGNAGDENGSGLGLYIVKELVEKMNGSVQFINCHPGLEAYIILY